MPDWGKIACTNREIREAPVYKMCLPFTSVSLMSPKHPVVWKCQTKRNMNVSADQLTSEREIMESLQWIVQPSLLISLTWNIFKRSHFAWELLHFLLNWYSFHHISSHSHHNNHCTDSIWWQTHELVSFLPNLRLLTGWCPPGWGPEGWLQVKHGEIQAYS